MITQEEIESNIFLPAIRRGLTLELKKLELKQVEIAKRLGLTKAAVTQYIKNLRGHTVELDTKTKDLIKKEAKAIKENKSPLESLKTILKDLENRKIICACHKRMDKGINKNCDLCFKK
jgi:uncharacterized protein